jgi:hypothetical protein
VSGLSPSRSGGRLAGFGPQLVVVAAVLAVRVAFILVADPTVPRVG